MNRRACLLVVIGLLLWLSFLAPAGAQQTATSSITQTVVSGGLNITATSSNLSFGTVTLSGNDQTVNAVSGPSFVIIDASGSNSGWNLTFSATAFSDGTGTIANSNFTFNPTGGTISTANATTQTVDATNGPREVGGSALPLSSSVKVVTTAAGFGKGTYTYVPAPASFGLTVPATTVRGTGTFTSTMTVTINSGP